MSLEVLHLVATALLEEQQQVENSSGDEDVTFNYTCKITRQYTSTNITLCPSLFDVSIFWKNGLNLFTSLCPGPGEASTSGSVLALLESLQNAPHLEMHKDMITWILKVESELIHSLSLHHNLSPGHRLMSEV